MTTWPGAPGDPEVTGLSPRSIRLVHAIPLRTTATARTLGNLCDAGTGRAEAITKRVLSVLRGPDKFDLHQLTSILRKLYFKSSSVERRRSTKQQKVSVTQQQNKQVIVIEPAVPDTIYVPYYDPAVVYGGWPYPDYPPYYFPPPLGYVPGAILATGIAFGAGYALGRWASGGNYWGGGVNWGGRNINVNRPININNINISGNNWQHNPVHRQGVQYSNTNVQQKFGNNNIRAGSQDRMDFRGRSGDQVLKPGSGGCQSWRRQGGQPSQRLPTARPGNRPDAGNRPASAARNRPSAGAKACRRRRSQARQRHGQYPIRQSSQCAGRARTEKASAGSGAAARVSAGGGGAAAARGGGAVQRWRRGGWRRRRWRRRRRRRRRTPLGHQRQARHRR